MFVIFCNFQSRLVWVNRTLNREVFEPIEMPCNETYIGATLVNFLVDIPTVSFTFVVENESKTFLDYTVNVCRWLKSPIGFSKLLPIPTLS